jgi:hypothetical protein
MFTALSSERPLPPSSSKTMQPRLFFPVDSQCVKPASSTFPICLLSSTSHLPRNIKRVSTQSYEFIRLLVKEKHDSLRTELPLAVSILFTCRLPRLLLPLLTTASKAQPQQEIRSNTPRMTALFQCLLTQLQDLGRSLTRRRFQRKPMSPMSTAEHGEL